MEDDQTLHALAGLESNVPQKRFLLERSHLRIGYEDTLKIASVGCEAALLIAIAGGDVAPHIVQEERNIGLIADLYLRQNQKLIVGVRAALYALRARAYPHLGMNGRYIELNDLPNSYGRLLADVDINGDRHHHNYRCNENDQQRAFSRIRIFSHQSCILLHRRWRWDKGSRLQRDSTRCPGEGILACQIKLSRTAKEMEQILGVAVGVVLTCLLLSIIASHVLEMMAAFTAKRAVALETAICKMVGDPAIYEKFVKHPLIETISFQPASLLGLRSSAAAKPRPTYIASPLFTRVLLVSIAELHNLPSTDVTKIVASIPDSPLRQKLGAIILGIEHDSVACVSAVEQWYDGTMDRVNGLYKRHTQSWLLVLGIVLAILCNANLFNITQKLWTSKDARDAVTATAQMYSCKDSQPCKLPGYETARGEIQQRLGDQIPVGYDWDYVERYWHAGGDPEHKGRKAMVAHWGYNFAGWLLTAIAVSLGAPFWFDMLNKLVNLRLAGVKPDKATPVQTSGGPEVVTAPAASVSVQVSDDKAAGG